MMLVGPSGCGKTTLISVIAGILDQDAGECRVFGEDLANCRPEPRPRFRGKTIGFVFQAFNLLPTLSAVENAAVPLLINGLPRRKRSPGRRRCSTRVGPGRAAPSPCRPSSPAGSSSASPSPERWCTTPADRLRRAHQRPGHETGHRVMELLREVALAEGRALVIVTHDSHIFEFADRVAKLDDGQVLSIGKEA